MFNLKKVGQMAINRWMDTHRWWSIPAMSYRLAIRKGQTTDAWSTGESQKQDVLCEKPDRAVLYSSITGNFNTHTKPTYGERKQMCGCWGRKGSHCKQPLADLFGVLGELSWLEWSHQCLPNSTLQMGPFYVCEFKLNKADSWRRKRGP